AAVVVVWVVVWTPAGLVAPVAVACGTLVAAVEAVVDLELLPQPARSAAPASEMASQVDGVPLIGHDHRAEHRERSHNGRRATGAARRSTAREGAVTAPSRAVY